MRKRQLEQARTSDAAGAKGGEAKDSVELTTKDQGTIARYVGVLKGMDPTNLHKLEDLKARIANGSYTADAEELADMILGLSDGRDDRRGA